MIRASAFFFTFVISFGAMSLIRFWHGQTALHEVVSELPNNNPLAIQIFTLSPSPTPMKLKTPQFDFDVQVGIAEITSESTLCLSIWNASLIKGDQVLLVIPNTNRVRKAVVLKRLQETCTRVENISPNNLFYSLKLLGKPFDSAESPELSPPYIALIGLTNFDGFQDGGVAKIDLDRDGRREYFRDCTSQEGLHITIWSGKPLKGARLFHWYYYLGYDVVPSCTEKDYGEEEED